MNIRYTPSAIAEIDEIYAYIAADNSAAAEKVIERIQHTISLIAAYP